MIILVVTTQASLRGAHFAERNEAISKCDRDCFAENARNDG